MLRPGGNPLRFRRIVGFRNHAIPDFRAISGNPCDRREGQSSASPPTKRVDCFDESSQSQSGRVDTLAQAHSVQRSSSANRRYRPFPAQPERAARRRLSSGGNRACLPELHTIRVHVSALYCPFTPATHEPNACKRPPMRGPTSNSSATNAPSLQTRIVVPHQFLDYIEATSQLIERLGAVE